MPITNTATVPMLVRAEVPSIRVRVEGRLLAAVTVPPGGSTTASVPLVAPYDRTGWSAGVGDGRRDPRGHRRAGIEGLHLLRGSGRTAERGALDHVDFGNATSEAAHRVAGSGSSGTGTLAGYTRRFSLAAYPGSWFSADLKVTPGKPFILRNREVFAGQEERSYNVYVDGTLLKTVFNKGPGPGPGSNVYDLLVDGLDRARRDGRRGGAGQVRVLARLSRRPLAGRQLGRAGASGHAATARSRRPSAQV